MSDYKSNRTKRPAIDDENLIQQSTSETGSSYLTQLKSKYNLSSVSASSQKPYIDYDQMELNQHIIDLWTVLRKIVKIVGLSTIIILILPGYSNNTILINPYKPAVLQILNLIINYTLQSLLKGGDVSVFVGSPLAPISFYLNLGAFIAILVSLPITIKEMMSFVRPGLTEKEWNILKNLTKIGFGLFLLGAFVSYFIIMPVTLRILAASGGIVGEGELLQMYSLESVLNLLLWGTLGGGILYASPVILLALVDLGTLTPDQIANRKREIIFAIFGIAAFVTPDPTIVSMVILSVPMIIILEFIMTLAYRIELDKILE